MTTIYRELLDKLPIRKHRLDDELEIQGELHHRIAEEVARLHRSVSECRDRLDRVESGLIRDAKVDNPRQGLESIKLEFGRDASWKSARDAYLVQREEHERWEGLLEAWRQRGYALSKLADLWMASYYAQESGGRRSAASHESLYRPLETVISATTSRPRRRLTE